MYGRGEWRRVNGQAYYCMGGSCAECVFYYDGSTCESEDTYFKRIKAEEEAEEQRRGS